MAEAFQVGFVVLFGLGLVGTIAGYLRFRSHRGALEAKVGPLPTPGPVVVTAVALVVLVTRVGEVAAGWPLLRLIGVGLGVYALLVVPLAVRVLGRQGVPGIGVLRDHALVTSGPYQHVRHPGYSGVVALWLGAALATLNGLLLALWPLLIVGLLKVAREEERLLHAKFGSAYAAYARRTGRFVPRLRRPQPA
ncbi:MAG: isoprenylcysteine carboxylmethyltransferase family protein [Actinomycetota bacterium]|nr:isoprenylcysteine carboxylmethyltransferase family protein [Actinomycetota bacterium]